MGDDSWLAWDMTVTIPLHSHCIEFASKPFDTQHTESHKCVYVVCCAVLCCAASMPQGEISVLPWTELEGLHRETSLIQVCHILTLFRVQAAS